MPAKQLPDECRPAFREDHSIAVTPERLDDSLDGQVRGLAQRTHLDTGRKPMHEVASSDVAGHNHRSRNEPRMKHIDVAAGGDDDQTRALGALEPAPELGELGSRIRKHVRWCPPMSRAVSERSRPKEDGVRARAQQAHHEPIGPRVATDQRAG